MSSPRLILKHAAGRSSGQWSDDYDIYWGEIGQRRPHPGANAVMETAILADLRKKDRPGA
jgi:hypothetical protein